MEFDFSSVIVSCLFHSISCAAIFIFNWINNSSRVFNAWSTSWTCEDPIGYMGIGGGGRSYKAWKWVIPVEIWKVVLYQNSAHGKYEFHFHGHWWIYLLRYYSKHRLTTSIIPSVWGWYGELIFNLVLDIVKNSCQNLLMNMESRSLTIVLDMPCNFITPSTNFSATYFTVNGWDKDM